MRYKKKPVEIEAFSFQEVMTHGLNHYVAAEQDNSWSFDFKGQVINYVNMHRLMIHTLEGDMLFTHDDMLIVGVKGEVYPCKLDIFNMTYDQVI
jgi:hypothetical protein